MNTKHEKRCREKAVKRCGYVLGSQFLVFGILMIMAVFALAFVGVSGIAVSDPSAQAGALGGMVGMCVFGIVAVGKDELEAAKAKCIKAQGELGTIKQQMEDAKAKGEDGKDEYATAARAYESKALELKSLADELEKKIAEAKEEKRMNELNGAVEELTKTIVPDVQLGNDDNGNKPGKTKAVAIDYDRKCADQERVFFKFIGEGAAKTSSKSVSMSDQEIDLMQPTNKALTENKSSSDITIRIPDRMYAKMLKANWDAMKKDLPMMSSDGADDGGRSYLYWGEHDDQLRYLKPTNPSFYDRVRKIPVVGGELIIPKVDQDDDEYGGVAVTRYNEGSTPDSTEANFKQTTIKCYPLGAYSSIANIMLHRDRVGIESFVLDMFGSALRNEIDGEVISGGGDTSKECLGIRTAADTNLRARETAGAVSYNDLVNLEYDLPDRVLDNYTPSYACSRTVLRSLKQIKIADSDTDGERDRRPLFSATTASGLLNMLNNYPYFRGKNLSTLGNVGDVIYGVWEMYWLGIEMEGVITRSVHAKFLEGSTVYRIDTLVGGKPLYSEAFSSLAGVNAS